MSPDSRDLANYENYIRRELPRLVRSGIEETLRRQMQPFEGSLISSLVEIIQICQDRVFRAYRETATSSDDGTQALLNPETAIPAPQVDSETREAVPGVNQLQRYPQDHPDFLDTLFQVPPPRAPGATPSMLERHEAPRMSNRQGSDIMLSDSGYGSGQRFCTCLSPCTCSTLSTSLQDRDVNLGDMLSSRIGSDDIDWEDWNAYLIPQ
jgi:hypothetical protein